MPKVRNRRPYAVEIVDSDGHTFSCAANPGVVEVPERLAKSLLAQEDNWLAADEPTKKEKG